MTPDYHTHTPLCKHAEGHPREYAAAARRLGLPELGLSDHSPMRERFDDWRMDWEEFPRYLEMVEEARAGLESLPESEARQVMEIMADFVVNRPI